jgi:hypothetical protein
MIPSTAATPLAARHFAVALLYLIAGSAGLVWIAPEMAIGAYASPHVAGITHLFTLGWISITIFGALCQLLPVALGSPLRWLRAAHVTLWTFASGAGLFAAGVATASTALHHAGIALLSIGILTAVVNIGGSLLRSERRDPTWGGIALAIAFLFSTLVLGVVLLHNIHTGFLAAARFRILGAHLHVAMIGWALTMIVAVSHRLLPMFMLSNRADTEWTKRSLILLSSGTVILALALIADGGNAAWLGVMLIELGVACFCWQVRCFERARVKKKNDVALVFVAGALVSMLSSAVLGPFVLIEGPSSGRLAVAYVTLGLLGGIVMYVVGLYYKIVPLLAWTTRYGSRMGKEKLPAVTDMYSHRVAVIQLIAMFTALTLIVTGIATASPHVARCGSALFLGGVLLFASQIARVAYGGRK